MEILCPFVLLDPLLFPNLHEFVFATLNDVALSMASTFIGKAEPNCNGRQKIELLPLLVHLFTLLPLSEDLAMVDII